MHTTSFRHTAALIVAALLLTSCMEPMQRDEHLVEPAAPTAAVRSFLPTAAPAASSTAQGAACPEPAERPANTPISYVGRSERCDLVLISYGDGFGKRAWIAPDKDAEGLQLEAIEP